ncbi:MAG: DUF5996 family protein [Acidimicrobiales bacterium]
MTSDTGPVDGWPELPSDRWADTIETLHLWTQVIGKIRLAHGPWLNHSWGVPLYVSTRGLRTSMIPFGLEAVELELDLLDHRLTVHTTTGQQRSRSLRSGAVADFHRWVLDSMTELGMPVTISPMPSEIPDAIPFDQDTGARVYDPDHATALWRGLVQADRLLTRFRAGFTGKASPVHFFWGSFDLATTRFSGRSAPPHPGGVPNLPDDVAREAYSQEVTSAGFWPGNRQNPEPIFYAYAYPTPDGFAQAPIEPGAATWLDDLGEFALPYSAVAAGPDPDGAVLSFLSSTHAAAADRAGWARHDLETADPHGPDWWRTRPQRTDRPAQPSG